MVTNKFFRNFLFALTVGIGLFSFNLSQAVAYPVFAQQNYSNPRAANGKLACANCHLNQKAIEIEARVPIPSSGICALIALSPVIRPACVPEDPVAVTMWSVASPMSWHWPMSS